MQRSLDIARTLFAKNSGYNQWVIYALLLWLKDSWVYIRLSGFVAWFKYVCVWPRGYCWYVFCASVGSLTYPNTVYNPYLAENGIESSGLDRVSFLLIDLCWFLTFWGLFPSIPRLPIHSKFAFLGIWLSPFGFSLLLAHFGLAIIWPSILDIRPL